MVSKEKQNMKKTILILTALASLTIANANAGITVQVEPYGHDANGYPVYSARDGAIYNSDGQFLGYLTGNIFSSENGRWAGGWFVRSPSGKVFRIYCN